MTSVQLPQKPHPRATMLAGAAVIALVPLLLAGTRDGALVSGRATSLDQGMFREACDSYEPYFLLTSQVSNPDPDDPAVISLNVESEQPDVIARHSQVGSVYGLAYDPEEHVVYAAAGFRALTPFGPGGPGAIYRINIAPGSVEILTTLDAGPDRHELGLGEVDRWIGISSLGDIDLDPTGSTLFVSNLYDGRIYAVDTVTGRVDWSARHGASADWSGLGRVHGLTVDESHLYHAVVYSGGDAEAEADGLRVYRTPLEGGGHMKVFGVPLDAEWGHRLGMASGLMPVDISLLDDVVAVALRTRQLDSSMPGPVDHGQGLPLVGFGQLVVSRGAATLQHLGAISSLGGAVRFGGLELVTTVGVDLQESVNSGSPYFPAPARLAYVTMDGAVARSGQWRAPYVTGDIDAVCQSDAPSPQVRATATEFATLGPGGTAAARGTELAAEATLQRATAAEQLTALAATAEMGMPATATFAARNARMFTEACAGRPPVYFVTCFAYEGNGYYTADRLNPYDDTVLVAFTESGNHLPLTPHGFIGSTYGLAYDWRRSHLYASAYVKAGSGLGPEGPGGIYRVDLLSGQTEPWVSLPAGPIIPRIDSAVVARELVGTMGLGDIEVDEHATQLFAVNLFDRQIYRLALPGGELLGTIPNGALDEPWSADARPFGLGIRDGHLFHAVVNAHERRLGSLTGHVYRSRFDGSGMTEVARFDLGYHRDNGRAKQPRAQTWGPWRTTRAPRDSTDFVLPGHEPMITDVEFRPNGDMILGLRNRVGDMGWGMGIADGDTLRSPRRGDGYIVLTDDHYKDDEFYGESTWGGLAALPGDDRVASTYFSRGEYKTGSVVWYSNELGQIVAFDKIYGPSFENFTTFDKSPGLGDVETACQPQLPTITATPTSTPSATPTATPLPTASATATASGTPSRVPEPIYLPVLLSEDCETSIVRADVVLVVDQSTSMLRSPTGGRTKLDMVKAAAGILVRQMDFERGDRVAVIGFNHQSAVLASLTDSRVTLEAALARLESGAAQGTRLDLALAAAADELALRGRFQNQPVVVLLTDGLPNGVPTPAPSGSQEATVLRRAAEAKAAGSRIYTIGIGRPDAPDILDRIDAVLLRAVASQPTMYHETPDGQTLESIYHQIAVEIGCPAESFWGRRSGAHDLSKEPGD